MTAQQLRVLRTAADQLPDRYRVLAQMVREAARTIEQLQTALESRGTDGRQ
jgi:hypothetical protein